MTESRMRAVSKWIYYNLTEVSTAKLLTRVFEVLVN